MAERRRIPDWGWTVVVAAWSVLAFGLTFAFPSSLGAVLGLLGAVVVVGLGAGMLAKRSADLLGALGGTVVVFEVLAAVEIVEHGGPLDTLGFMFGTSLIAGGFAALVGLIVLGVRRRVGRMAVRAGPLRAAGGVAGIAVAFAGLATLYVLAASTPNRADVFRVTGEREIVVTVTGGNSTWCRVTAVRETAADITIGTACVSLILGPTTAVGIPTDLVVRLAQPLADRIVRNEDGSVVRQNPPPVHAVDQGRATGIALGVLQADHPGIKPDNTKILDLTLEKDPSGRAAWKVNIIVDDGPFASSPPTTVWLWIDAESGAVTIISRG